MARMGATRNAYGIFVGSPEGTIQMTTVTISCYSFNCIRLFLSWKSSWIYKGVLPYVLVFPDPMISQCIVREAFSLCSCMHGRFCYKKFNLLPESHAL